MLTASQMLLVAQMVLALIASTSCARQEAAGGPLRIELSQRPVTQELSEQLHKCYGSNKQISKSYMSGDNRIQMGSAASGQRKHTACHVALRSAAFMPFIGRIQIGDPPQTFEALFDTGSDTLWVAHSRCQMNGQVWPSDKKRPRFASDKSRTFKRPEHERLSLKYGPHMELNGWWVSEIVSLEDPRDETRSISVADQPMGLICNVVGPEEHHNLDEFTALVGLSFPKNESSERNTLLETMFTKKLVDSEVFSFYTGRKPNKLGVRRQTGELIIGQLDPELFVPPITWAPVAKRPMWQIHVESIRLLDQETARVGAKSPRGEACPHGCQAVVDTGTSMIVGPHKEVAALNKQLGFERNELDVYFAPGACAKYRRRNLSLVFGIHNSHLELEPEAYLFDVDAAPGVKICVSAMRGSVESECQGPTNWILGAPFVANFYTIFDYNQRRVGFAQPAGGLRK